MMKLKNTASAYAPVCCGDMLSKANSRREFMRLAGGAVLFSSFGMLSAGVQAASGNYEAMVLSCIDPRFQDLVNKKQASDGLSGKYSAFTIPAHPLVWSPLRSKNGARPFGKTSALLYNCTILKK